MGLRQIPNRAITRRNPSQRSQEPGIRPVQLRSHQSRSVTVAQCHVKRRTAMTSGWSTATGVARPIRLGAAAAQG